MTNLPAHQSDEPAAPSSQPAPWRVVLVEDHVFVRELMTLFLAREHECYQVVAEVATVPEALEACRKYHPHLLILDVNLPGMSGIEAVPTLRAQFPSTRVLICSGSVDERQIGDALRAGPDGFIEKTSSRNLFLEAIATVLAGGNYYCERSRKVLGEIARGSGFAKAAAPLNGNKDDPLTARENQVLRLIAAGKTSKQAGAALGVSEGTIVTHRVNLMRKLDLHNAASLIRYALTQS